MAGEKNITFFGLLWQNGFVINVGGIVSLDKLKACDYLYCSLRTLDRWIKTNNPCPRAVALLENKNKTLPLEWKNAKFVREKLVIPQYPYGLTIKDIAYFSHTHSTSEKNKTDTALAKQLVEQNIDGTGHAIVKKNLLKAANQLNALARDPIFDVLKLTPRTVINAD